MTDARLPDRWLHDRRLNRLKDGDYRSFMQALMWSVSNRTEGVVEPDDLLAIPGFNPDSVPALIEWELWASREPCGWLIADFPATQSSRAELDRYDRQRAQNRERQARHRAKTSRYVTRDITRDLTGDHLGKARQGKARIEKQPNYVSADDENDDFESAPGNAIDPQYAEYFAAEPPAYDEDGYPIDDREADR